MIWYTSFVWTGNLLLGVPKKSRTCGAKAYVSAKGKVNSNHPRDGQGTGHTDDKNLEKKIPTEHANVRNKCFKLDWHKLTQNHIIQQHFTATDAQNIPSYSSSFHPNPDSSFSNLNPAPHVFQITPHFYTDALSPTQRPTFDPKSL